MFRIFIRASHSNLVTIRRLHDILGFSPFDYEPINNYINSQILSKLFKVHIDMSIIENKNYWAKLGRQGTLDAPPIAAARALQARRFRPSPMVTKF